MGIFDFFKKKASKEALKTSFSTEKTIRTGIATSEKEPINISTISSIRKCYIAFDLETTGLSPVTDRIIELGAVLFSDGQLLTSFSSLINPGIPIPPSATSINHITNDMIKDAPTEDEIFPQFIDFLGNALHGDIVMCAHNAPFDCAFLCNTLSRLGYDANIKYVDTLALARKYIHGLDNYKQITLERHLGLTNDTAHRAASDATNCGKILAELLDCADKELEIEKQKLEQTTPTEREQVICAYIQDLISKQGGDISWLRYSKNSSNYVEVSCLYTFLKFKFSKKGNYLLVKKNYSAIRNFITEPCTQSEGGSDFVRVFFSSPFDLAQLSNFIYESYLDCYQSLQVFLSLKSTRAQGNAKDSINSRFSLSDAAVEKLLHDASHQEYTFVADVHAPIARANVTINAAHTRIPLAEIINYANPDFGFDVGYPYWEKGESARKSGHLTEAIELFDLARYNGYDAPALYNSYAMTYRQLKDYDNEIVILEEGLLRIPSQSSIWEARRDKAIKLLYEQQETSRKALEKEQLRAEKRAQKEEAQKAPKQPQGKVIFQLSDDGNIIKEFESIAAASKEVGVSTKSIRDAAKGVQKHAGGFKWQYKDDFDSKSDSQKLCFLPTAADGI